MSLRAAVVIAAALALASCVPWTVRPIQREGQSAHSQPGSDPVRYAATLWNTRLTAAVVKDAVDARALVNAMNASPDDAGRKYGRREGVGSWQFMVKGEGRVLSVDTSSRNGTALLDIAPFDGRPDVSIQIGPVLLGTSVRDATGLVHFTDFENQIQFADVANELNHCVLTDVLAHVEARKLAGKMVIFAGTFSLDGAGSPAIRGVVPVSLTVETNP